MNNMKELELKPFICLAFANNTKIYNLIKKQYEKKSYEYYTSAIDSKWYHHEILNNSTIEKDLIAKQVLGMLEYEDFETFKAIENIIKNGWSQLYEWVHRQKFLYLSESAQLLNEKLNDITDDELIDWNVIALFLATLLSIPIIKKDGFFLHLCENLYFSLKWHDGENRYVQENIPKEERNRNKAILKELYTKKSVSRYNHSFVSNPNKEIALFQEGFAFLYDIEKISSSVSGVLTERDMEEIIGTYIESKKRENKNYTFNSKDINELAVYVTGAFHIKSLLQVFRKTKEKYFKDNKDTSLLEIKNLEETLTKYKEENQKLIDALADKNKEIQRLQKQIKQEYGRASEEYRDKIKELELQNQELQAQLANQQKEDHTTQQELEELIPDINLEEYKVIICGGHGNWHNKLKEILPSHWVYIHPDERWNGDIAKVDAIFFYTDYLNHATSIVVMNEARKKGVPVHYLENVNTEQVVKQLKKELFNQDSKNY